MRTLDRHTRSFYQQSLDVLKAAGIRYLVGGGYALTAYTGIERHTKDLDLFVLREDAPGVLACLKSAGYQTDMTFPHWLGKARLDDDIYIDIIFSSGNGVCEVDEEWYQHAVKGRVLERDVLLVPAEEMLWSKAFVMERERFDGADVAHLLLHRIDALDWGRLRRRFGANWRLLYSHLILFGFIYPSERQRVPRQLMADLSDRALSDYTQPDARPPLCQGTLLSRAQYLCDVGECGFTDARLESAVGMSVEDLARWTEGIAHDGPEAA